MQSIALLLEHKKNCKFEVNATEFQNSQKLTRKLQNLLNSFGVNCTENMIRKSPM